MSILWASYEGGSLLSILQVISRIFPQYASGAVAVFLRFRLTAISRRLR